MKNNKIIFAIMAILFVCAISVCSQSKPAFAAETSIDYSDRQNWLAVPKQIDKPVDVFYLYPTIWSPLSKDEPTIAQIDNAMMRRNGPYVYDAQATAFETAGNVFAPYYRQVDAISTLALPIEEQMTLFSGTPGQDVFDALDYYFEHYNEGRPFILAGHSQGSAVLLFVLADYMKEHPDLYKRMIAAYLIGYSVTDEYLKANPHLKFAQGADDTGVIISFNTEAPNVTINNPVLLEGARVINPISWTLNETPASATESLGSRINGRDIPNFADATLDLERGVVMCSTVAKEKSPAKKNNPKRLFGEGIYHAQDCLFYYYDIRANAELRANNFLDK